MPTKVKHTCPDIDKVQKQLKSIIKEIDYVMKRHELESEVHDVLDSCKYELDNAIDVFEDLRRSNSQLRYYGDGLE